MGTLRQDVIQSGATVQKYFNVDYSKSAIDLSPNYYELATNDSIIGYMCLQQAPSKHDMFDF